MDTLQKSSHPGPKGPVVLVIMDGVGIGKYAEGDAVRSALKPNLDWLKANVLACQLKAHGKAPAPASVADDFLKSSKGMKFSKLKEHVRKK